VYRTLDQPRNLSNTTIYFYLLVISLSKCDYDYRRVLFLIWIRISTPCTCVNQLCCDIWCATVVSRMIKSLIDYSKYISSSMEPSRWSREYLSFMIRYIAEKLSFPRACIIKDAPGRCWYSRRCYVCTWLMCFFNYRSNIKA
jgi:hypothetical protein